MDDADQLRNRATRMFVLARKAREDGHPHYAEALTRIADEALGHAVTIERRRVTRAFDVRELPH
jgi:hypothetical protein